LSVKPPGVLLDARLLFNIKEVEVRKIFEILFVVSLLVCLAVFPVMRASAAGPPGNSQAQAGLEAVFTPELTAFIHTLLIKGGWLLLVILIDLVLGVTVALKQKTFRWDKLADFLGDYGPKVIAWIGLELLGLLPTQYKQLAGIGEALGSGAYIFILVSGVASILGHAQAIGILRAAIPGILPTDKKSREMKS
jgi:hypothetical protein